MTILTSDHSYLIVGQVDVLHGQQGQLVRPVRVSSVLHVPGDGEELHGRHDVRGRVDDDLIGRFKADGGTLAQVEGVERTVGRILQTADTSISSIYILYHVYFWGVTRWSSTFLLFHFSPPSPRGFAPWNSLWKFQTHLGGALEGQCPGAVGQLLLLDVTQVEPHDCTVRHDGAGDRS